MGTENNADALYVHVPFCVRICPYCDFPKVLHNPDWSASYLTALFAEAKQKIHGVFKTIYIGGGTPSCLSEAEFESLLSFFEGYLAFGGEYSVECNPETVTEQKAALLAKHRVNRVSLGVQSLQEKGLHTLGRNHDKQTVLRAIELLRGQGITNLNVDWMYGFPEQSEEDLDLDIQDFLSLHVPHISAYSLILEKGTVYSHTGARPLSDDEQQTMFERIEEELKIAGYRRYEISNFCKPGYECRHNLTYWRDERYVALGLGASGYEGNTRYVNTKNLGEYLKGNYRGSEEVVEGESEFHDFVLTNLRLTDGFELRRYQERFGQDFEKEWPIAIERLKRDGLLVIENGRAHCTKRGLDLLDYVLLEFY